MGTYLSIPIESNGNPMAGSTTAMVPLCRLDYVNAVLGLGPFENQNVNRVWEALKSSSYTIDNAITFRHIQQKIFGNKPGILRKRLAELSSKIVGKSIASIFSGKKSKEQYQIEEELRIYDRLTSAAICAFSRHLRKVGTHIFPFEDQNGERRYTIVMDDETIDYASEIHRKRIRTEQTDNKMLQELAS